MMNYFSEKNHRPSLLSAYAGCYVSVQVRPVGFRSVGSVRSVRLSWFGRFALVGSGWFVPFSARGKRGVRFDPGLGSNTAAIASDNGGYDVRQWRNTADNP